MNLSRMALLGAFFVFAAVADGRTSSPPPPPADMAPGTRVGFGRGEIIYAWLVKPTERYRHGVFGDSRMASALRVMWRDGGLAEVNLPEDQVFEDLEPRIVDANGDGRDEVMVVRSGLASGSALTFYGLVMAGNDRRLALLAQTPALGRPQRWLNPVGIGDMEGDGRAEIVLIRTPHLGGVVELYRWTAAGMEKRAELAGYSNHVAGSSVLQLSAMADMDGDGRVDLVVPTQDRRAVAVIGWRDGQLRELWRESLPAAATGAFSVISPQTTGGPAGNPVAVWIGLENGERFVLSSRHPPSRG